MNNIRPRCTKNKDGHHQWIARSKSDGAGHTITGYICACGAKQYVDLL